MKLSEHFTLEEMISSQTAAREGLDNTPDLMMVAQLKATCEHLEVVRELLGHPIIVSSGYRSAQVNIAVGGAKDSAHCKGFAADILCPGFGPPFEVCKKLETLIFDQLIYEFGAWTHISFDPRMRREVLSIKHGQDYQPGLVP